MILRMLPLAARETRSEGNLSPARPGKFLRRL